jgi:AraC-like DNA-binding protein
VENRTRYAVDNAELNIFETHKKASQVALQFSFPIVASMLQGKKVMQIDERPQFDFYPGESVVLSSNSRMLIDFPEATENDPTVCLALGIDTNKIQEVISHFNEKTFIDNSSREWKLEDVTAALVVERSIHELVERLVGIFTEGHASKDVFADFAIKELLIRLLQSESRKVLINETSGNQMALVIQYINDHLAETLKVGQLAQLAGMSKSHFFRCFKNTFGQSPVEYINYARIKKSKDLILKTTLSMEEVSRVSGFNNLSYFIRQFKKQLDSTPYQFKKQAQQS